MKPVLLLLLLPFLPIAADTWQSFAVDTRVTVQLPAPPTEADMAKLVPGGKAGRTRLWMLQAPEGLYQVLRIPSKGTIAKQDTAARSSYYAGVLSSVLRNEQGRLLARTPFPTTGGVGMEFKYNGVHRGTGKRVIKYTRYLVLDSIGYSLNFIPADRLDSLGLAGNEQRRRFFNSIVVKP